jgi:hypothetical protein
VEFSDSLSLAGELIVILIKPVSALSKIHSIKMP